MSLGLEINEVSHAYGAKRALEGVSFSVGEGRFCALLGPNGAGKSTLFSLLCRLIALQSGTIEIAGIDLTEQPRLALASMGIVFQQSTLDLDLTVRQNLKYFAGLHGLSGKLVTDAINQSLERLDMAERIDEKVRSLNGGHRRRMEIARAIIHSPKILLLDEPTVGLDAQTRKAITEHVHDLAEQYGITILWATHLVDEVKPQDDVVILHRGQVIRQGIAKEISGDSELATTFAELTSREVA